MIKVASKTIVAHLKKVIALVSVMCVALNTSLYTYAEPTSEKKMEIIRFVTLDESIQKQTVEVGTTLSELNLPSVLNVELLMEPEPTPESSPSGQSENQQQEPTSSNQPDTPINLEHPKPQSTPTDVPIENAPTTSSYIAEINDVKWTCEPEFNTNGVGQYIFTPVLPSNYVMHPDAVLPTIEVNVFAAPIVETPQILLVEADPDNNSDILFYFADSYDSYQWQKQTSSTWENIEGQTNAQLRLTKEQFYASAYRCLLVKNGSEFNSEEINFSEPYTSTNHSRAATESEESDFLKWYAVSMGYSFDIHGKDSGTYYKTTFNNGGYATVAKVNGTTVRFSRTRSNVSLGSGLYADVDLKLVSGGRYLQITYTVRNTGTEKQSFQIGSNADVMIDKNDRAPIQGAGSGRLTMTDGSKYQFNLIVPDVSTLWYGNYSGRSTNNYANMFGKADMSNGEIFKGDSGLAYSWDAELESGQTWKKSALIGVGKLADPPEFIAGPTLSTTLTYANGRVGISGTLKSESNCTVYAALDDGSEFEIYKGEPKTFSGTITMPANIDIGATNIRIWAISDDGGTSQFYNKTINIGAPSEIKLATDSVDILEETVISDYLAYFKKYVASHKGTLAVDKGSFSTDIPGSNQQVIISATFDGTSPASATLKVNILPLPLKLEQNPPTSVDSTNSFNLSATLRNTGPDKIIETGFVWGIIQNPTLEFNNGSGSTATAVTSKRGVIHVTTPAIAEGVIYYARPYVKTENSVSYGDQRQFSINGKACGTFSIAYTSTAGETSTFTITRAEGTDEKQTVYYRTVNGSAIGGTHFTAISDKVEFAEGETSKTITVQKEDGTGQWSDKLATKYSNANRNYWVEIYRVEGGARISPKTYRAERTIPILSSYSVSKTLYDEKNKFLNFNPNPFTAVTNYKVKFNDTNVSKIKFTPKDNYVDHEYIHNTSAAYATRLLINAKPPASSTYKGHVLFSTKECSESDVVAPESAPFSLEVDGVGSFFYTGYIQQLLSSEIVVPQPISETTTKGEISISNWSSTQNPQFYKTINNQKRTYLISEKDSSIYGVFAASIYVTGLSKSIATQGTKIYTIPYDIIEPQVLGIAPFSTATYKPGDKINVSLVFDEIVDATNSVKIQEVKIKTNYGEMEYKGGADTNILYFEGTVPENAPESVILTEIINADFIKDMSNIEVESKTSGFTGTPSADITVDNKVPQITASNQKIVNGKARAKIDALNFDDLKYTFSADKTMPVTGWVPLTNGSTVSVDQPASYGKQYLHVMATYNLTGATDYEIIEFDFGTAEYPTSPIPVLTLSTDNSQWSTQRIINVTRVPSNAVVTYTGPQSGTVSGNSVTVTQSGTYTFTLTVNEESFTQSINVTNIDVQLPVITLTGATEGNYGTAVNVKIDILDMGESEIKTVSAQWKEAGGTSLPVSLSNLGGTLISPVTSGDWKLFVTAVDNAGNTTTVESPLFKIIVEKPSIVINQISSSNTGVEYSYVVTPPTGATITEVTLPDGTKNQDLTGSFTLKQPGTYYVTAADDFGHFVRSGEMVVAPGVDGEAPDVRLSTSTDEWVQSLTVHVSLYDNNEPVSAEYSKKDELNKTTLSLVVDTEAQVGNCSKLSSFEVSENGTYTVITRDAANNENSVDITIANIDTEAPNITLSNPANSWTSTSQAIEVVYKDNDGGSGIASAEYAIVGSNSGEKPQTLLSMPASGEKITVDIEGESYIYYKLVDNAKLVSEGYTDVIKVDTVTPTLTVTTVNNGSSVDFSASADYGVSNGEITLTVDDVDTAITNGNYRALKKGKYVFTATSSAGLSSTSTTHIYDVSFASNGGTGIDSQLVISGAKITAPTAPTKVGYQFKEWQKEGTSFNFEENAIVGDTELSAIWELEVPTVTLSADKTTADYTGNKVVTLTADVTHVLSSLGYDYAWYKNGSLITGETAKTLAITDVNQSGSYTVKVKANDGKLTSNEVESSSISITINKAVPQISDAPSAGNLIYGQTLEQSNLSGGKVLYKTTSFMEDIVNLFTGDNEISGNFSWTEKTILPTFSDSGKTKYSVTFTPDDTDNIATATVEITVNVAKKKLTPSVNTVSDKTYDGNTDATGTLALAGAVNNESPQASGNFSFSSTDAGSDKTVDVSSITLEDGWDDNYVLSATSLNDVATIASINPLPVELTWKDWENLTYDGNAVNVTAAVSNLVNDDTCTVTVSNGSPTDAGKYTATAISLSNKNYTLDSSVCDKEFIISKAPVSFVVSENEYEYDGGIKQAVVLQNTDEQPLSDLDFLYHYEQDGLTIESPINKGKYDIMVKLNNDNFMHKDENAEKRINKVGTLEILGKPYPGGEELQWPSAQDLTYGQTLSESALFGDNLSSDGTYSWKEDTIIPKVNNIGNYVVFRPNDSNYATVEKIIPVNVTPKQVSIINLKAQNREYKPDDKTITITDGEIDGIVGTDDVELDYASVTAVVDSPDADTQKDVQIDGFAIKGEDKDCYVLSNQPTGIKVDITPTTGSATVEIENWVYGDQASLPNTQSATNVGADITYIYEGTGNDGNAYHSDVAPKNAGNYTVKAIVEATQNYKEVEVSTSFEIEKRTAMIEWSGLVHMYDGSAASVSAKVQGLASTDTTDDCSITIKDYNGSSNAGKYVVNSTITGNKTFNYDILGKNSEVLTILPATVNVTISDLLHEADGSQKKATVTVTPNVSHTITYRTRTGEVSSVTEAGAYDVYVALNNNNYRFENENDGTSRKFARLIVYENTPPVLYTVRFDSGSTDATGSAPSLASAQAGEKLILPYSPFTRSGHVFAGWKYNNVIYQPHDLINQPPNNEAVFTAQWTPISYDLGGTVNHEEVPVSGVKLVLMRGSEKVAETYSLANGEYKFSNLLPGTYNLIATKAVDINGDIVQTIMIELSAQDIQDANIILPNGKTNSVLEILPGSPKIIINNLDQSFDVQDGTVYTNEDKENVLNGGEIEIKLTVQRLEKEEIVEEELEALKSAASNAQLGMFMDLDVQKKVVDTMGTTSYTSVQQTDVLLEMVIPLPIELQGKYNYSVIRMHNGTVDVITQNKNAFNEHISVNADKTAITLYSMRFSTYVLAYTDKGKDPIINTDTDITESEKELKPVTKLVTRSKHSKEDPSQIEITKENEVPEKSDPIENKQEEEATENIASPKSEESQGNFNILNALFVFSSFRFSFATLRRKKNKKMIGLSFCASILAVSLLFFTTEFNGIGLVDFWCVPIALLTIVSATTTFIKFDFKNKSI